MTFQHLVLWIGNWGYSFTSGWSVGAWLCIMVAGGLLLMKADSEGKAWIGGGFFFIGFLMSLIMMDAAYSKAAIYLHAAAGLGLVCFIMAGTACMVHWLATREPL